MARRSHLNPHQWLGSLVVWCQVDIHSFQNRQERNEYDRWWRWTEPSWNKAPDQIELKASQCQCAARVVLLPSACFPFCMLLIGTTVVVVVVVVAAAAVCAPLSPLSAGLPSNHHQSKQPPNRQAGSSYDDIPLSLALVELAVEGTCTHIHTQWSHTMYISALHIHEW